MVPVAVLASRTLVATYPLHTLVAIAPTAAGILGKPLWCETQAVTAPGDRFSMAHKGLIVQGRVLLGPVKAVSSQFLALVEAVIGHLG